MPEMNFDRYFTLEEAQSLLPVVEALLKRALEAKRAAEEVEEKLEALGRKVFLLGGMFLDIERVRRNRAAYEAHMQQAKDSLGEIDAIGVQVKDLDTGLLDFPCSVEGETVLLKTEFSAHPVAGHTAHKNALAWLRAIIHGSLGSRARGRGQVAPDSLD